MLESDSWCEGRWHRGTANTKTLKQRPAPDDQETKVLVWPEHSRWEEETYKRRLKRWTGAVSHEETGFYSSGRSSAEWFNYDWLLKDHSWRDWGLANMEAGRPRARKLPLYLDERRVAGTKAWWWTCTTVDSFVPLWPLLFPQLQGAPSLCPLDLAQVIDRFCQPEA